MFFDCGQIMYATQDTISSQETNTQCDALDRQFVHMLVVSV